MSIPTNLKHKPVIVADDYANIDGHNAHNSDVGGISLGLAQWNDRGKVDISLKIWRESNGHWSRLSEELPIHRVLDLAIMYVRARESLSESYRYPQGFDTSNPTIDRIGLQGDAMTVRYFTENEQLTGDLTLMLSSLAKEDELICERLHVLSALLKEGNY